MMNPRDVVAGVLLCGLAVVGVSCAAEATGPARLEFRRVATRETVKPEKADEFMKQLAAGRVGQVWKGQAWPAESYTWVPTALPKAADKTGAITGEYQGRRYVLVSSGPYDTMVPGEVAAWGLTKVEATTDESGAPAVAFELDEPGKALYANLTTWGGRLPLATLVDGTVVSAPRVEKALTGRGTIAGRFTREEAAGMARRLAMGMPPEPMPGAREWARQSDELSRRAREAMRQTKVLVEFEGQELGEAVQYLREKTRVNIHVNWRALARVDLNARTPVTLKLKTVSAERALGALVAEAGGGGKKLMSGIECGVVTITTPGELAATLEKPVFMGCGKDFASRAAWLRLRGQPLRADFEGQELSVVLDYLRETTDVPIHVKWEALDKIGVFQRMQVTIAMRTTVPECFLQCILEDLCDGELRVGYVIEKGMVVISTAEDLRGAAPGKP